MYFNFFSTIILNKIFKLKWFRSLNYIVKDKNKNNVKIYIKIDLHILLQYIHNEQNHTWWPSIRGTTKKTD